jgi:hypothetical protein
MLESIVTGWLVVVCLFALVAIGVWWLLFRGRPDAKVLLQTQSIQHNVLVRDHQDWLQCRWINMQQIDNIASRILRLDKRRLISNTRDEDGPNVREFRRITREQGSWYVNHASMNLVGTNRQIYHHFGLLARKPSLMEPPVMWKGRLSLNVSTQLVPARRRVWPIKKWDDELQFILHPRRYGVTNIVRGYPDNYSPFSIVEGEATSDDKVKTDPWPFSHLQLLRASLSGALSRVSRRFVGRVHLDRICRVDDEDADANHLYKKRSLLRFVNESPSEIRNISLKASLECLPTQIRTIAKYTEIVFVGLLGLFFVATGLVVIHTMLPFSRGHMVWVNLIVGFGSLAVGVVIIFWMCFFFDPAHSDYRPVVNVSSLCLPFGPARTSARLGAAS